MRTRIASLTILLLALAALPAWAQNWTYDNGPINGTTDAWTINFGYIVSDTFVAAGFAVNGFSFGTFQFPGDTMLSVDWSITSGENSGTVYGSGTASGANLTDKFLSQNQFGYYINEITVTGLETSVTSGTTYWLNLQNAVIQSGDPAFWDENSGKGCRSNGCPSSASESSIGTIPSESFTVTGSSGGTTPEPGSFILLASGVLGLAGVLRRKLL
jgi:PEP-CTERM motif